jgi:hypothetical protein
LEKLMKLTFELDTDNPNCVADAHQLAELLDRWVRPEAGLTNTPSVAMEAEPVEPEPVEEVKKTRKKRAAKPETPAPAEPKASAPATADAVKAALTQLTGALGRDATVEAMAQIDALDPSGTPRLSLIQPDRYEELLATIAGKLNV